jgi:ABC-2 type transport system ATP-binding protein
MNIIEARGLGKRYGRTWALRDCSLDVPAGHVGALVGPNGAGKTTLLHIAVGLAAPSAGQIRVLGDKRPGSPPALAGIGFVAQDAPLYRHLSVTDTLHLARSLNRTWDQQRAAGRMADLGIAPGRSVGSLSGGQQAQLALTIALAKRPQLLILDEPMARLDPLARHDFLGVLMAAVAEDGLSVIFSSHVVAELERVADYLIVLAAGRVQMAGEVEALLAGHQILAGPAADMDDYPERFAPVHVTAAGMQAHLLVRTSGGAGAVPPGFEAHPVGLEELVLGYLREPGASALPGPVPVLEGRST